MLIVEFHYELAPLMDETYMVYCHGLFGGKIIRSQFHSNDCIRLRDPKDFKERVPARELILGRKKRYFFNTNKFLGLDEGSTHFTLYWELVNEIQHESKVLFHISSIGDDFNFQQGIEWGPSILSINDGRIYHASVGTESIDPTWYTRGGLWANSECAYLGREIHDH